MTHSDVSAFLRVGCPRFISLAVVLFFKKATEKKKRFISSCNFRLQSINVYSQGRSFRQLADHITSIDKNREKGCMCACLGLAQLLHSTAYRPGAHAEGMVPPTEGWAIPYTFPPANPKWTFETLFPGDSRFSQLAKPTLAIALFH